MQELYVRTVINFTLDPNYRHPSISKPEKPGRVHARIHLQEGQANSMNVSPQIGSVVRPSKNLNSPLDLNGHLGNVLGSRRRRRRRSVSAG